MYFEQYYFGGNMNIDLWVKRIWLFIGIAVLLLILVSVGILLFNVFISSHHDGGVLVGDAAKPKGEQKTISQDLSLNKPQKIGGTNLLYIGVGVRELTNEIPASTMRISKFKMGNYFGNLVNIIFLTPDGKRSYLLLNKKGLISTVDIPSLRDSLQKYDLFEIAFDDTDNDGRITASDSSQLFISDLNGLNLIPVTRTGDLLQWYDKSEDGKNIFIAVKEKPANKNIESEDWPERLYRYDVEYRKLAPFPEDGKVFDQVRDYIWGK
jgi:hypothetical protein